MSDKRREVLVNTTLPFAIGAIGGMLLSWFYVNPLEPAKDLISASVALSFPILFGLMSLLTWRMTRHILFGPVNP